MPDCTGTYDPIQKLKNIGLLQDNWDGDDALAPSIKVIRRAEYFLKVLQSAGQNIFHVTPGPVGEIMVDLRKNGNSVEILFYPEKTKYVFFPATGRPEQGEFQLEKLPELLNWLNAS